MATDLPGDVTAEHLRESNLIEDIDDPAADAAMEQAWIELAPVAILDLETVLECHWAITKDQLGGQAGVLRQVGVRVGRHVAPPWEQVSGLLADWLRGMHTWSDRDPREMHVAFEKIHPFVDGNGRVGRLLYFWHQVRLGQPPTLLRVAERQAYYTWFRQPDDDDVLRRYLLGKIDGEGEGSSGDPDHPAAADR